MDVIGPSLPRRLLVGLYSAAAAAPSGLPETSLQPSAGRVPAAFFAPAGFDTQPPHFSN